MKGFIMNTLSVTLSQMSGYSKEEISAEIKKLYDYHIAYKNLVEGILVKYSSDTDFMITISKYIEI